MRRPLLWYSVASIGPYALVPPVVTGLLLPAGLLLARASGPPELAKIYIDFSATLVAPAVAVWWPPFVFKERVEGDGRELLHFLKPRGEGVTALALAVSYWVALVPFVLLALNTPGFEAASVPILLGRCLFMSSLAFCTAFVLHSIALALILGLIFNLVLMEPLEVLSGPLAAMLNHGSSRGALDPSLVLYVALSAALLWTGEIRSRRLAG